MIVLIDNYDSFTYNLVQYLGDLDTPCEVYRNNQITINEVLKLNPKGLMISPGPSDPDHAGICLDLVKTAAEKDIPLFGVCLGHQTIGQVFGSKITKAKPMHGKVSKVTHTNKSVFKDLPSPLAVTRYHSLIVKERPEELEITSQMDDGMIMGVMHKTKPIHGVQFHPESIETEHGHAMLKNFTDML